LYLVVLLLVSVAFIIYTSARLRLHPFLALLGAAFLYALLSRTVPLPDIAQAVMDGYGSVVGEIGIIILSGSIIGVFLDRSGGALSIADAVLRVVGRRKIPLAMTVLGYVVGIPVFCDSGFVILSPLNKALSRRANMPLAAGAIALSLGLYATHALVPPTPGPVAAAAMLQAHLGLVILWGLLSAFAAATAGYLFSVLVASRFEVGPEPETAGFPTADEGVEPREESAAGGAVSPSLVISLLPLVVPVALIVLGSVAKFPAAPFGTGNFSRFLEFAGSPTVALLTGAGLAFLVPRRLTRHMVSTQGWAGEATVTAATIIVITGAGGAFGRVLVVSGLPDVVTAYLSDTDLGIMLPFLLAAAIKTAQGSSTVAMLTAAGIVAPLIEPFGLDTPTLRALTVVAIGAGAMTVSHANDSYFWIVTQLSHMSIPQGYRLQTLGTALQGTVALLAIWAIANFIA